MPLKRIFQTLIFATIFIPTLVSAEEYEFEIKELILETSSVDRTIIFPIDLGTSFQQIDKVSIYFAGKAYPGEARSTDGTNEYIEMPVSFQMKLADEFAAGVGNLFTPVAKFETLPEFFEREEKFKALSQRQKTNWDFLMDGYAELKLSWGRGCPGGCLFIEYAFMKIENATLVINGVTN